MKHLLNRKFRIINGSIFYVIAGFTEDKVIITYIKDNQGYNEKIPIETAKSFIEDKIWIFEEEKRSSRWAQLVNEITDKS